jgi:hypothetical protein
MTSAATMRADGPHSDVAVASVLRLAARGWRLFPCLPRSKKPYIKDWPTLATTDPAQLQAWVRNYSDATGPWPRGRTQGCGQWTAK